MVICSLYVTTVIVLAFLSNRVFFCTCTDFFFRLNAIAHLINYNIGEIELYKVALGNQIIHVLAFSQYLLYCGTLELSLHHL